MGKSCPNSKITILACSMTSLLWSITFPHHHRGIIPPCGHKMPVVVCPADVGDMRRVAIIFFVLGILSLY